MQDLPKNPTRDDLTDFVARCTDMDVLSAIARAADAHARMESHGGAGSAIPAGARRPIDMILAIPPDHIVNYRYLTELAELARLKINEKI